MHSLAAHRADSGLRTMVKAGSPIYLEAVNIRGAGPPLDEADIAQIEALLKSEDVAERLQGINLAGFLGSEVAGPLLSPILEDPASTSDEAGLARGVLMHLDYYRPSLLEGLKAQLVGKGDGEWIASFLAESGDPDARAVALEWLAAHPLESLNSSVPPILTPVSAVNARKGYPPACSERTLPRASPTTPGFGACSSATG